MAMRATRDRMRLHDHPCPTDAAHPQRLQNPGLVRAGRRAGVLRLHHLHFFAKVLGELFFPPGIPEWTRQLQTFGIFAAGYLIRPLGGIVMAHLAICLVASACSR